MSKHGPKLVSLLLALVLVLSLLPGAAFAAGSWSEWSTTPAYESDTREVETRQVKTADAHTEYRYGRYIDETGKWVCWCATYQAAQGTPGSTLQYTEWSTARYSPTGHDFTCGFCKGEHIGVSYFDEKGRPRWHEYKLPGDGDSYYWEESREIDAQYETQYRYRDIEQETSITVTFDAGGGSVDNDSITVKAGGVYGGLPTPTRDGYTFDGWYTAASGGTRIVPDTTVVQTEDHTLYAHWTADLPEQYTVTFNAGGGSVSPTSQTVTLGEPYGDLPTPTRDGYTFDGWYTDASIGSRVTESTTVSRDWDHSLYAHWTYTVTGPALADLTYSFGNHWDYFQYSRTYKIPLARYQLMFGNTPLAQYYYANAGAWGGSCYGMSSTSCLFSVSGNGISANAFKGGAALPSELSVRNRNSSWDLTLTEFIEAMQVSQNSITIQSDYQNNRNQLNSLCRAVKSYQQTGKEPVVVAIFGPIPNAKGELVEGGHAIVGYGIVDVSASQSRLMVYDCNYPNTERFITLTKNSSGQYTGWYYHMNDRHDWGSDYSGSWIAYVPYSHFLESWNSRKGAGSVNLLNVNTANAAIKDVEGNVVATIRDGEIETDRDDIYPLINIGLTEDGAGSEAVGTSLWLPSDSLYTVENTDRSVRSFEVTMVNVEQSAAVSTTASEVTLAVSDEQELNYAKLGETAGDSYTITLSSSLNNSYGDVELEGTAEGNNAPVMAQISGKLYANGVDLSTNASLRVDGSVRTESILSGELPENSMLGSTESKVSFTDVPTGAYYSDAVYWAVEQGITTGTSTTTFSPDQVCTETQILTFLWRAAGQPASSLRLPFAVNTGLEYAEGALCWAYAKGMIDSYFNQTAPCTRSSAVKYIWQAKGRPFTAYDGAFTDVAAAADCAQAVAWAVDTGVTNGTGTNPPTFSPDATCSRGQIVTFLYRAYK